MKLPTSIILSELHKAGWAGFAAFLLGCGGSVPLPEHESGRDRFVTPISNPPSEKGTGAINFHYSNKSTDARMQIDLSTTDVYLEMSGQIVDPENQMVVPPLPQGGGQASNSISKIQNIDPPVYSPKEIPVQTPMSFPKPLANPDSEIPPLRNGVAVKNKADFEESLLQEDQERRDDKTSRVLAGIRKAQELFYQKQYSEALRMARQSLEALPTAEGHALAGSICYMLDKVGLARRHWGEALRLNPDMPAVVNMLERTRTPGGRGSPSPRPIFSKPSSNSEFILPNAGSETVGKGAGEQAPFPEEFNTDLSPIPTKTQTPDGAPASDSLPKAR